MSGTARNGLIAVLFIVATLAAYWLAYEAGIFVGGN